MRRYQLWFGSFQDISNYVSKVLVKPVELRDSLTLKRYKRCEALKFSVRGEVRDKFSLVEIDSLTCSYHDEKDFLNAFDKETNGQYLKMGKGRSFVATYQYNNELRPLDLVYDSPLLQKYALMIQKNKGTVSRKLAPSLELEQFCNKLLQLVANPDTRDYVFSPFSLPSHISIEEKRKLARFLPSTKVNEENELSKFGILYQNPLYQSLEDYSRIVTRKREKEKEWLPTYLEEEELIVTQKKVYHTLQKNYTTLRNAVLFMNLYEAVREKEDMIFLDEEEGQLEFFADSKQQLHILSPEAKREYDEYKKVEGENADILFQVAQERKREYERQYESCEVEDDGYSFEEKDMDSAYQFVKDSQGNKHYG